MFALAAKSVDLVVASMQWLSLAMETSVFFIYT